MPCQPSRRPPASHPPRILPAHLPAFLPVSSSFPPCQVDLTEFEEPDDTGGDALWSEEEDFF